jgi:hypothetical protein
MTVPYTFGTATTSIPLSNLDANFNTPITLGNTAIYLGNTTTTIGNLTLTNVTISSGTANITSNITYATANAVVFTNSSSIGTTGSTLTWNGTQLGVGTASPGATLNVYSGAGLGSIIDSSSASGSYTAYRVQGTNIAWFGTASQVISGAAASDFAMTSIGSGAFIFGTGSGAERMRIRSDGKLLVGYTVDQGAGLLQVNGTGRISSFDFGNNGAGDISWVAGGTFTIGTFFGSATAFKTSNTERMRISDAGLVGIGTTSPTKALDVYNTTQRNQIAMSGTNVVAIRWASTDPNANERNWEISNNIDGQGFLSFRVGASQAADPTTSRMTISSAGIVTMSAYGAGTATFSAAGVISSVSDETWKIKDGVPTNTDAMLQKLEPGYWFYNEEKAPTFGEERQLGFYAQNVHEAIGEEAAPTPQEGKPWGYHDRSVLAIAVMSLKNALNTIEELKQRIETLENK